MPIAMAMLNMVLVTTGSLLIWMETIIALTISLVIHMSLSKSNVFANLKITLMERIVILGIYRSSKVPLNLSN